MCRLCQKDPSHKALHRNKTSFRPGDDPRRHQFTREEQQRGYRSLMCGGTNNPPAYAVAWVWRRIRAHYRRLQLEGGAEC
jgi:hypothetical protein